MLVPATWQGSVEHFYHFLLGYFMPIVLWQERTGELNLAVRDCGPMNNWFDLLREGTRVEVINPGAMLQRFVTHRQKRQVVHYWDDPRRFHSVSMDRFAGAILGRFGIQHCEAKSLRLTVLERRASHSFYKSGSSEAYGSGAEWRSVPNIAQVAAELEDFGNVTLVDTAELSPQDQILLLSSTDVLVAQHGAGLSNMVWMPPWGRVLEIQPPLAPTVDQIFSSLAAIRGLQHCVVRQGDEHALVEPPDVVKSLRLLLSDTHQCWPRMPGKLPMRILRQLPRRL